MSDMRASRNYAKRLVYILALALFINCLPLSALARSHARVSSKALTTPNATRNNSSPPKNAGAQQKQQQSASVSPQQVESVPVTPAATATVNMAQLAQRGIGIQNESKPRVTHAPVAIPEEDSAPGTAPLKAPLGALSAPPLNTAAIPVPATNFQGMDDIQDTIPPDTNGAVGLLHVVVATNSRIKTYLKTGTLLSTVVTDTFWSPVFPSASSFTSDPHVIYDPFNNRWIQTIISDPQDANSSVLVAVTQTSDPTGTWNLFRFDVDATNVLWADYPMLGFNKDWIFVSLNMFPIASGTSRGQIYAFNKANMYANSSAGTFVFNASTVPQSLWPAVTYDNTLATEFLVRHFSSAGGTERKSTLVGAPPAAPTLTVDSATVTSTLGGWTAPPNFNFFPQSGTTTQLEINDARIQNAVVRTIGGVTSLWFCQNIVLPAGGSTVNSRGAAQWWKVDASSGSTTTVQDQGRMQDATATRVAGNTGNHFGFPSVAVNKFGDMLMGYTIYNASGFASAGYTYRAAGDAAGTTRGNQTIKAGEGTYIKDFGGGDFRWGDYSHTVVDPVNDTDMWTFQEYAATPVGTGADSGRWGEWVAQVVLAPTAADATLSGQVTTPGGNPLAGVVMQLNGDARMRTITDAQGNYKFENVESGKFYTIAPERANYSFSPTERSFSLNANKTDAIFTATPSSIATSNPLDTDMFYVRQQYMDFLGREPDAGGLQYWTNELDKCGLDQACLHTRRIGIAAAFFMEDEYQQTGSFVYRLYKGALGRQLSFNEFSAERQRVIAGPALEQSKADLADQFVQREEFVQKYSGKNTAESFVDALISNINQTSGADISGERGMLIARYNSGGSVGQSRSLTVREAIENDRFKQAEYNSTFVLMEYFGYLKRDPDEGGYNFWLNVLNEREPGNYRGMVCSFITSAEYQQRFSPFIAHSNRECGK